MAEPLPLEGTLPPPFPGQMAGSEDPTPCHSHRAVPPQGSRVLKLLPGHRPHPCSLLARRPTLGPYIILCYLGCCLLRSQICQQRFLLLPALTGQQHTPHQSHVAGQVTPQRPSAPVHTGERGRDNQRLARATVTAAPAKPQSPGLSQTHFSPQESRGEVAGTPVLAPHMAFSVLAHWL